MILLKIEVPVSQLEQAGLRLRAKVPQLLTLGVAAEGCHDR